MTGKETLQLETMAVRKRLRADAVTLEHSGARLPTYGSHEMLKGPKVVGGDSRDAALRQG